MTRKFNPEKLNFLGTCFSLVSHSEQFSKNFCSVNSSLLLKQHSFNYSLKLIKQKQVIELTLKRETDLSELNRRHEGNTEKINATLM